MPAISCPLAEVVRLPEGPCIGLGYCPVPFEHGEGLRGPSPRDAVPELEHLDGPLDVGQRSLPELQMEFGVFTDRYALFLYARFHPADLGELVFAQRGLP